MSRRRYQPDPLPAFEIKVEPCKGGYILSTATMTDEGMAEERAIHTNEQALIRAIRSFALDLGS